MVLLCGVDDNGKLHPLGVEYDAVTGLASLAVSRAIGKTTFTKEYTAT
jgi:hypothetical protein